MRLKKGLNIGQYHNAEAIIKFREICITVRLQKESLNIQCANLTSTNKFLIWHIIYAIKLHGFNLKQSFLHYWIPVLRMLDLFLKIHSFFLWLLRTKKFGLFLTCQLSFVAYFQCSFDIDALMNDLHEIQTIFGVYSFLFT